MYKRLLLFIIEKIKTDNMWKNTGYGVFCCS